MGVADIGDVEVAEPAVEARPPRIAQSKRKDFVGSRRAHEGVVGRDGIVARGIAGKGVGMHVDAQDLAEQAVDVLRGVRRAAAVAGRDIEVAVGTEAEPAGLVVGGGGLVDGDDRRDARGVGDVRIRRDVIAADLGVARRIDQIDVEKAVAGEVGIEGEAEQAALAGGRDLAGHVEERRCQNLSGGEIEDFDLPGLLDDEQAAGVAGRRGREKRLAQTRRDPGRNDCGGLALRSVRVEAIDQVRPGGALQRIGAVVADDEIDGH